MRRSHGGSARGQSRNRKLRRQKLVEPQHGGGCAAGRFIKWHTIRSQEDSVLQDVLRIREHPLVPKNIPIYGYIYDVKTGRLNEVAKATEAGRAA